MQHLRNPLGVLQDQKPEGVTTKVNREIKYQESGDRLSVIGEIVVVGLLDDIENAGGIITAEESYPPDDDIPSRTERRRCPAARYI